MTTYVLRSRTNYCESLCERCFVDCADVANEVADCMANVLLSFSK